MITIESRLCHRHCVKLFWISLFFIRTKQQKPNIARIESYGPWGPMPPLPPPRNRYAAERVCKSTKKSFPTFPSSVLATTEFADRKLNGTRPVAATECVLTHAIYRRAESRLPCKRIIGAHLNGGGRN